MKLSFVAILFLIVVAFVRVGASQTAPADSQPVLQGTATYSMPQSAIDAEIGGSVLVAIRVDETGKPSNAVLISGPAWPCGASPVKALQELSSTLADTMMKARFTPAVENGKPIAKDIGFRIELKNPKLLPGPPEIDPATGKPKPSQVSGGVVNGKAMHLEKPAYPSEAKANGENGTVTVQVLINEEGKVIRAGAVQGASGLQFAARDAACKSKFNPTILSDVPIKVSGVVTYTFVR